VAAALALAAAVAFRILRRHAELEATKAEQAHLATLGGVSAVLAHEIRNPLASLKGHAQLLAEALQPDHAHRRKAERVVHDAVRLEQLTDGLLAFVRTGALDRRDGDPREPLRRAVTEVGGAIEIDDSAAPPRWAIDAPRLQQVLENVLRNAHEASPQGATVNARLALEAGELVYEVLDRGTGIRPGEEERIFEPFRTHKATGTGLGLAVARRIVELHGGRISARNRSGGGATLRIALPPAGGSR
jgi:two-component system sensor histidine kinase HydH